MSNRGGSRYRGDDDQARRYQGNRGASGRDEDDWESDDRYLPPPPRRQGSSQGASSARQQQRRYDEDDDYRGGPSRSRKANAWDDDASWEGGRGGLADAPGWDDQGDGPTGWNDPRYTNERRGAPATALGAFRGASGGRAGRDGERRSFPIRVLLVAMVVVGILTGLGFGVYSLLRSQGQPAHSTVVMPDASFATYTPGPTPTPPANFKEFASARSKYILSYPGTWAISSNDAKLQQQYDYTDIFNPPNSPSHVSVEQAGVFSYYTEQKIIQGEVAGAQQSGYTFTEVATAQTTQTVGGAMWQRREYDINANGQPLHMAILATHHGGKGYVIVLVSSAAEFGNDAQAVFDPLLASFRFSA